VSILTAPRALFARAILVARAMPALVVLVALLVANQQSVAQTSPIPLWTGFQVKGDIAYLLRKSPAQIMRYDLAQAQWMTSLALQDIPSGFVVGEAHIYVASDRKIERFDLLGGNKSHVANTPNAVIGLFLDGNILIANRSEYLYSRFSSYHTSTHVLIDTHEDYPHSLFGASHSPSTNRIYGRTSGISPADIDSLEYDNAGNFLAQTDSPYHGDYPSANSTWTWPNGSKVVDGSGTVYLGADLTYAGTLSSEIADVAFHGTDVPIVLTGNQLVAYSQALIETGRAALTLPGKSLSIRGNTVFVFNEDPASPTRVGVEQVPLSSLSPAQPGAPVSPIGLSYDVTASAIDASGVIYLLSKVHSSVFRWDVGSQKYLSTIPLTHTGDEIAFSSANNALYVLGSNRTVYRIALGQASLAVSPFVTAPAMANFLLPIGQDLLVAANGSWNLQWIYSPTGTLLNSSFDCCYARFHFYDEARSRLFLDSTHLIYLGNGQFSGPAQGPYISSFAPLRLSPDGQRIITTAGVLYQASPLQAIDYLSNSIIDAQWASANQLFTIREPNQGPSPSTRVQKWSPYLTIEREQTLAGRHVALFRAQDGLVEVTSSDGIPRFRVLDLALNTVAPAVLDAPSIEVNGTTGLAVGLRWVDVQGEIDYQVERRSPGAGTWLEVGLAPQDATSYVDVDHHSGQRWEYRVRARNAGRVSAWSNVVAVDLSNVIAPVPVDPTAVQFVIDDALIGSDDQVYILSKQHKSIFVWNSRRQRYETSIGLRDAPLYMAYSQSREVIYLGYQDRSIHTISLNAAVRYEHRLTTTTDNLCGIVAADDVLVACDLSGAWESTHTYDALGQQLDYQDWRYPLAGGVWSNVNGRIYHLRDGTSPNDLLYTPIQADGSVGQDVDSPYHSSTGIQHPIRVSPDGAVVLLGSGHMFNALSLDRLGIMPTPMADATWLNGRLITLLDSTVSARVDPFAAAQATITINGVGRRVFAIGNSRLVVAMERNGTTVFEVYNASLGFIEPPVHSDGFE
jgi:hypothetical protein